MQWKIEDGEMWCLIDGVWWRPTGESAAQAITAAVKAEREKCTDKLRSLIAVLEDPINSDIGQALGIALSAVESMPLAAAIRSPEDEAT